MKRFAEEFGFAFFCLALGMASGFLAGRDWSAKSHPASTASISGLTALLEKIQPDIERGVVDLETLIVNMPQPAIQDNAANGLGLPAMAVASGPGGGRSPVDIGDSVLISADQLGRVYAICMEREK